MVAGYSPPHVIYVPPDWPVVELAGGGDGPGAHRTLVGFDGRVGDPAQRARLGWRSGSSRAVIQTSVRLPGPDETLFGRFDAVFLALAGAPWSPTFHRGPSRPAATHRAIETIAADAALWHDRDIDLDGVPHPAEVAAATPRVLVGRLIDTDPGVAFAVTGLAPTDLSLRTLTSADGYDLSPLRPATSGDLSAAEKRFWR